MKTKYLLPEIYVFLFLLIVACKPSPAQEDEPVLELSATSGQIHLGEKLLVTLKIIDPNLPEIVNQERANFVAGQHQSLFSAASVTPAFTYSFSIEPQDTGILKIGPYSLSYQNLVLESNTIYVRVLNSAVPDGDYVTIEAPAKVKYMSEGTIIVKSKGVDISESELAESEYYIITGRSNSKSVTILDGKMESSYTKTFNVLFEKRCTLELNGDNLQNVKGHFEVADVRIVID